MAESLNRVLVLYENWKKEEEKLKSLHGLISDDKQILKAELDFLSKGIYRIGTNPNPKEDLTIRLMKSVFRSLEKQIYPNRFLRGIFQLKVTLIDRPRYIAQFGKFKQDNLKQVDTLLKIRGLDQYSGKLDQYLDFERSKVSIDLTANLNGNVEVDYRVHLAKNDRDAYQMTGLEVQTTHIDEPEKDRYFNFGREYQISADKAVNLLMGRAVVNGDGESDKWIQMVSTGDADQSQVKVFQADQGFNLKDVLYKLAAEIHTYRVTATDFAKALREGHQVKLEGRHPSDLPVYLEANPGGKGILIRDLKQNVIGVDEVFLGTKLAREKDRLNQNNISKNKDQDNHQDQSPGIGL